MYVLLFIFTVMQLCRCHVSVHPSDTSYCYAKMAKRRIMQTMPHKAQRL